MISINPTPQQGLSQYIEYILHRFSIYLVPLVVGLISVISLVYWPSQYTIQIGDVIEIQALQEYIEQTSDTNKYFYLIGGYPAWIKMLAASLIEVVPGKSPGEVES